MRCRCGFDVALCKQRGPVDGVFKSLVTGQSGDWSVQVLLSPDAVQRLGADLSPPPDTRLAPGTGHFRHRAQGTERLTALRSRPRLRRLRVVLAAPQPEPKPGLGQVVLANVNIVEEVMNRNIAASRIPLPHGNTGVGTDVLRPALTLPLEQLNGSGAPCHAAA